MPSATARWTSLLKPVKNDDLLRAVEKCLPVQPEHSAPAPASDTGSHSDAFSRVAEMEPASYILTAVQPLGLTARNAMERQLIEFSIFGQLDTLCRQTGQGTAFQKKGQCYLLLVNMTQAQATGWLHDAQALLEQRTKCKVGFVCSPATAEMSAVPNLYRPLPRCLPLVLFCRPLTGYRACDGCTAVWRGPCRHRRSASAAGGRGCRLCRDRPGNFSTVRWKICWPLFRPSPMAAPMRLSTTCLSAGAWCRRGWNAPVCSARAAATTCWMPHARPPITRRWKHCSKKSLEELYGQMAGQVKKNEHKDIQKVTDYIAAHYRENLTLEVLAKHIHMNPFYFSSYFKKQLGQNFKDYLNRVRMEHALELLLNSDKRSYEIAEEVGFKDYRYFNEVFSRYYGKTPAAYRKSFKEQNNG